jgi:hypothetical protein
MGRTAARNGRRRRGLLEMTGRRSSRGASPISMHDFEVAFRRKASAMAPDPGRSSRDERVTECSKGVNAGRVAARAGAGVSASLARLFGLMT